MGKKMMVIVVLILFGAFGLTACNTNFDFEKYKTEAKLEIENYATEDNYSTKNWNIICSIVDAGKAAIEITENKEGVDIEVTAIKEEIDNIIPKLSEELERRIKADYLQEFGHELLFGDDLLNKFYGLYNGTAVFFIAGDDAVIKTVTISGIEFCHNYGWTILVWKDGDFYNLENIEIIFEAGMLSQKNVEQIGIVHIISNVDNE